MRNYLICFLWMTVAFAQNEAPSNIFNLKKWTQAILADTLSLQQDSSSGIDSSCDLNNDSHSQPSNIDEYLNTLSNSNEFKTDRGLTGRFGYDHKFNKAHKELYPSNALKNCKGCKVLDIGAGEAKALRELLASENNGIKCAIGVSPCKPNEYDLKKDLKKYDNFHYIENFVEEIDFKKLKDLDVLEKTDFILDIMGAFQYSNDVTKVLEKYSSLLKKEGRIYLSFVSEYKKDHSKLIKKRNITTFVDSNNNEIPFSKVLGSIQGFKIVHSQDVNLKDTEIDLSYIIEKTGEKVVIPEMELVELNEETAPPKRVFRLINAKN